jgi:type IV pilus assembly protein PilE
MRSARGFTLIELMITVAVIAILSAIALPAYTDYVTRSKFSEAYAHLADLRVKMEQYYLDNRRYNVTGTLGTCGIPGGNTPTTQGTKYFDFTCASSTANAAGDQAYVLMAAGKAAEQLTGIAFTVDHGNSRTTVVTGSTLMADKGYAVGTATCWLRKKPAQC